MYKKFLNIYFVTGEDEINLSILFPAIQYQLKGEDVSAGVE